MVELERRRDEPELRVSTSTAPGGLETLQECHARFEATEAATQAELRGMSQSPKTPRLLFEDEELRAREMPHSVRIS